MTALALKSLFATAGAAVLATCLIARPAQAADLLSDRLLMEALERHAPAELYRQADNPWPGGGYNLTVFKQGKPAIESRADRITFKVPLRIVLDGAMQNALVQVKLACKASFNTVGEIELKPASAGTLVPLRSSLTLPVPPTNADCNGVSLPVHAYISALVQQKRVEWQNRIDAEVNGWLTDGKGPSAAQPAAPKK